MVALAALITFVALACGGDETALVVQLLEVDDSGQKPTTEVFLLGGGHDWNGVVGQSANPRSVERLDATDITANPSWERLADMRRDRTNLHAIVLPTGQLLVIGGRAGSKRALDPDNIMNPGKMVRIN